MTTPKSARIRAGGTAAVVLAAGGGTRWAAQEAGQPGHKLMASFRGRPIVSWALEAAMGAGLDGTWVVSGAVDLRDLVPNGVRVLVNRNWPDGQATSLQRAVDEARAEGLAAIVVGLGDQPLVESSAWQAVAGASGDVAVATYDGQRRNPVKLAAAVWELLPLTGDEGARSLIRSRPDLVEEVPCQGDPADIDTREDLQRWS